MNKEVKIIEKGGFLNLNFNAPTGNLTKEELHSIRGGAAGCTCKRNPDNFTICDCAEGATLIYK